MSREIKFRAWFQGKMIDLQIITPLALADDIPGLFIPFKDDCILMQYTGRKDKHGKEIYEGDVITCEIYEREDYDDYYSKKPIEVHWSDNATGFWPLNKGSQWRSGCENIEVIGNIYENPELIKTKP